MTNTNQISKTPELPLISIYKNVGIEIINKETIKYFERTSAYSLIQDSSDAEMYSDKNGNMEFGAKKRQIQKHQME